MTSRKIYLSILLIAFALFSCEKDITVNVPQAEEGIVIEGKIETDEAAIVILSNTIPFFGEINTEDIVQNTITGATVIVADGITADTLDQIPGIGVYVGSTVLGIPGRTYKLTVYTGDKTLTAVTSIPFPVTPDSVWWKPEGNRDSLGFTWIHFKDPDTIGNHYISYTQRINRYTYGDDIGKVKDSTFVPTASGSIGDRFFNGSEFDINFARGKFQTSDKEEDFNDEEFFFKRGDTIVQKFCSINFETHEFWRTLEQQVRNNGNPFGSPAPITSNIAGGLGIWAGYAPVYDTIIAE